MEKISRFFAGVAEACHPSKGSFSGAMDVIVIERADGTLASTPFYVKFGRFKLIKSNNIKVNLLINNNKVPVQMQLSKSGRGHVIHSPPAGIQPEEPVDLQSDPECLSSEDEEQKFEHKESDLDSEPILNSPSPSVLSLDRKRAYRQNSNIFSSTIHMSSSELQSLNLLPNLNIVQYVTETKKQTNLTGRIFFWQESAKIIVSDIDGTLTKSDMLGHICYLMGKDWSRAGVVGLYSEIVSRNYKILYLSSRSISQVDSTRNLLNLFDQNGARLPQGPILLSPDGMFRSIVREVSNYSGRLKERTLCGLLETFMVDKEPFWAGFGNREGDAVAYLRAGVPASRVFILSNKKKKDSCNVVKNFDEVALNFDEHFPVINNSIF